MRIDPRLLIATATILLLSSCNDDPPTPVGPRDTTAPEITGVTPVDQYHVDVTFSEELAADSAQWAANYRVVETESPSPWPDIYVNRAVLQPDQKTVSLATYSSMSGLNLTLIVDGVTDLAGNAIIGETTFVGSSTPDETPPELISSTPVDGSTDAPIGTAVTFRFSEAIEDDTFTEYNIEWTSPGGPVPFQRAYYPAPLHTIIPRQPLRYGELQTITLTGLEDRSGNRLDMTFSFTTTSEKDDVPPTLVSSDPPNLAVNVSTTSRISLTFSEPIDRYRFEVEILPELVWDEELWSNDNRTVTYTLRSWIPLRVEQQYTVTAYPGGVYDLGGNSITDYTTVVFTTGTRLESGSISGRIFGDSGTGAAEPDGSLVIAESWDTSNIDVVEFDTYTVNRLQDGPYRVYAFKDTNRDGRRSLQHGDALGAYGADIRAGDPFVEYVYVIRSRHLTEVDFPLYDLSAVGGTISYTGSAPDGKPVRVGLFARREDATSLSNPVAVDHASWPGYLEWAISEFEFVEGPGTYYIAAFMDLNYDDAYDAASEPAGVYGGFDAPIPVHMTNGRDYLDIVVPLADSVPAARSTHVKWSSQKHNMELQQIMKTVDDALGRMDGASSSIIPPRR